MPIKQQNNLGPSIGFLVLANLIPFYGVVSLGWDIYTIFILYWLESAVVGFFNILKMERIKNIKPVQKIKLKYTNINLKQIKIFFIVFVIIHYSIFMFVHLVFINGLFMPELDRANNFVAAFLVVFEYWRGIFITLSLIFASHGFSYVFNFIKKKEYEHKMMVEQMFTPYKRILIMHITIIALGFLTTMTNKEESIVAIFVLVFIKIIMDSQGHFYEHKIKKRLSMDLHKG